MQNSEIVALNKNRKENELACALVDAACKLASLNGTAKMRSFIIIIIHILSVLKHCRGFQRCKQMHVTEAKREKSIVWFL